MSSSMCITQDQIWAIINSQDWAGMILLPNGHLVRFLIVWLKLVLLHSFGGICP